MLKHRTLFITGAARGIGEAIALRAAQDGANVVIAAKSAEPHTLDSIVIAAEAAPGDAVSVTPTDNARVPVEGELVRTDAQEFAIRRDSEETGSIVIHFPRTGFSLKS